MTFPPFFLQDDRGRRERESERDRKGQGATGKQKKRSVMKEQRRSFTFCFNRAERSSGSVPPGQNERAAAVK